MLWLREKRGQGEETSSLSGRWMENRAVEE